MTRRAAATRGVLPRASGPFAASLALHAAVLTGVSFLAVAGPPAERTATLTAAATEPITAPPEPPPPLRAQVEMPARPTETLDAAAAAVTDLADPFVPPPAVAPGTEAAPVLAFASPLLSRRIASEPTRTPSPATTLGPQPPAPGGGASRGSAPGPTRESGAGATATSAADPPTASSRPAAAGASRTARFRETPARPDYPAIARRRGWEGRVTLRLSLDAEGTVCDVAVETSSGRTALDEAAVEGAFRWRFEPALADGHPVPSTVEKTVEFRLLD